MLIVETIAKIRRLHFTEGKGIKTICRDLKLSKKVVRKVTDKTIWQVFQEERPHLVLYAGRFDGFHSLPAHSTIVLEPMANKVSYVEDLPRALRQ